MTPKRRSTRPNKNILKYFIDYITLRQEKTFGIKVIIFQLLCISLRFFKNSHGKSSGELNFHNIEVALYFLPNLFLRHLLPKREYVHFCDNCGPFVKGYTEVWAKGDSEPFKIEFFQYCNGSKEVVDEVILGKLPGHKVQLRYDYCGHCNELIDNRIFTRSEATDYLKHSRQQLL